MFKETLVVTSIGQNCVSLSNSNGLSIDFGFCSTHTSTEDIDVFQKYYGYYFCENVVIKFDDDIKNKEEKLLKHIHKLTSIDSDKFGIVTASFERKVPDQGIYSTVIKAPIYWFKDHFDRMNTKFELDIAAQSS